MAPSRRKGASKAAAAAAACRQWKIGDLVLAKVKGFPAWPATVSEPEKWGYAADWKKVLVYFFGTQQIAFCNPADVEAFTEEKKQSLLGKRHGKGADFVRAVREIVESYDEMRKQNRSDDANTTDGHTLATENNSRELSAKSLGNDVAPVASSQECEDKTHHVAEDHVNDKSGTSAAVHVKDGLEDKYLPENDNKSSLIGTEMTLENVDSLRKKFERTEALKCFTRRQPSSARRARSGLGMLTNKVQTRSTRSGTVAPFILLDGPCRRNKRIRKSPDDLYGHGGGTPGLVSNGSIEGNDSGSLMTDSDSSSLNEGITVDYDCKIVTADSSNELNEKNVELSRKLDFGANCISKRKRIPNRKRPCSDLLDFISKPNEKAASDADADAIKRDQILPGYQEISTERLPKEGGDEHLPLVKRARVRLGRISSTCVQLEASLDTEEKSLKVCFGVSDHYHASADRVGDDSTDKNSVLVKEDTENLLQPEKLQTAKPQIWEVKYQYLGSSAEGEAALPPSKRLHRALEAMSENAAEEHQMTSEVTSLTKVDASKCTSSSNDFSESSLEIKDVSECKAGMLEENSFNNKPLDGSSACTMKLDQPITEEGKASCVEMATCCSDGQQKSCEDNVGSLDGKFVSKSSSNDEITNVVGLQSSESLSPKGAHLCSPCSPGVALPSQGDCKTISRKLAEPSENVDHRTNKTMQSLQSGADMEIDSCADECDRIVDTCQLLLDEIKSTDGMSKDVGEIGLAMVGSSAALCPVSTEVMNNITKDQDQSCSNSAANDRVGDETTPGTKSSPSPTYNSDAITRTKQYASSFNISTSACSSNNFCSPIAHSHRDVQKSAGKWNYREAHDALMSFEGFLGTLTRTKESIGRATRSAIECAKCGVAAKVVEMLALSLEREASLHRRVDLFFLVDSIAQYSKSLKGDVGGVYPSAILAVLSRLLSAAAPPGSNSMENRRQCLKVLRVWQERRILPESIVRHHIWELDLLCSSCSRSLSRRLRNERAFDDPIREMEGMLVDEYGSNSSIQLPGFTMPPMLRDEDGVDSDGEGFEAVTPEHDNERTEAERNPISAVEKHRHILEDVDGELEMEDVAPPASEAVISSCENAATVNMPAIYHSVGNAVTIPFAPPLPMDIPPASPPLPKSPPPPQLPLLAPGASFPPEMPDNLSSTVRPVYVSSQNIEDDFWEPSSLQSNAPGVNPTICDALQSSRPGPLEFHSQVPNHLPSNIPSDGAYNQGFRLCPPHLAPSNQFSYVQSDHLVQSRRDIPPPSHSMRYNVPNSENGNLYRDTDRTKLAPHDTGKHWSTPAFHGPRYPDDSRMPCAPAPYAGRRSERSIHGNRWGFHPGATNHRMRVPHRPPPGGPIPVAARGPNCWRPR